jgi:adenylosuccinate lyase
VEEGEGCVIERYQNQEIWRVWTMQESYNRWHLIECVHMEQVQGREVADLLRQVRPPSPAQVAYHERETGHDVAAFLRALDDNILAVRKKHTEDAPLWDRVRSSLHYGLTSSDLVDTGQALALRECAPEVLGLAGKLEKVIYTFGNRIVSETTYGRTHGQLAAPLPACDRWWVVADMLGRTQTRVQTAFEWMDVGKLSGPVGTLNEHEDQALAKLELRNGLALQIVPRDRLAHLANCLGLLATVCEATATQVWLLAQDGIDELRVTASGTVGSSAMPHKTNPIVAENIRGLARMARSRAQDLQLGVVQWGEHDLAHSSVERVAVPDLLHLVCTALDKTTALVSGLVWVAPRVGPGYRDSSEDLRVSQADGTPYVDAHCQLTEFYRSGKIPGTTTEEGQ